MNMLVQPGRRRFWLITVIAVALIVGLLMLIITGQVRIDNPLGVNGPPTGTGDPGNRRLHELSNDAVFARLPSGAHLSRPIVEMPARYRQPVFDGGGWDGPSVIVAFVDGQPAAAVYQFYATQAATAGWQASHHGQLGYVDGWSKTYSDHATAWLNLYSLADTPQGRTYELTGGISVIL